MTKFKKGDYVIDHNQDFGRVARAEEGSNHVSVCYTEGCTSALTLTKGLRLATDEEIKSFPFAQRLGYHRFDDYCPDYEYECCSFYCPEKRKLDE